MRLEHPQAGKIQQGALFNCALVPGYEGCPCHGLVLTARCDLEHGKHSVINYLPVVRFSDWATREMCYLLAKRLQKSVEGQINKTLSDRKVTPYVLSTFPLRGIVERATSGKERVNLLAKLEQNKLIEAVLSLRGRRSLHCHDLICVDGKQADTLIRELIQGKLPEYYFLDAVDIYDGSSEGHVVILRHMQTLSAEHASRIVAGLERENARSDESLTSVLTFDHEPICMVTGVLRSPDIEHLAQYFANLFVRIGLEDHDDETVERHQNLAKG